MRQCDCVDCDKLQGKLPVGNSLGDASQLSMATKIRVLGLGLLLSGGFSVFEWTAGWWSHSLTLMTDAGHMLSDCLALGVALGATWLAQMVTNRKAFLGVQNAETLAALANGIGLIVLAVWVVWEAMNRFQHNHPAVVSEVMLVTAIIGLGVNAIAASALHDHSHQDLNIRGAFLHVLADTVSSIGVIVSAVLIWAFHWNWADQIISVLIAVVIGVGAFPLIHASLARLGRSKRSVEGATSPRPPHS